MTILPPTVAPVNVDYYPDSFTRIPDVAPFTERSGITYTALLESIRAWIPNTLVPYLTLSFNSLSDTWEDSAAALKTAVNAALAQQTAANAAAISAQGAAAVQAAATQLLSSVSASTDPAIMAVINVTTSATRIFLDTHYVKSDNGSVDTAVKAALLSTSSTTLAYLDNRFASTFNDANLAAILQNASGVARAWLDSRYLVNLPGNVDGALVQALNVSNSASLALLDGRFKKLTTPSAHDWMTNTARLSLVTTGLNTGYLVTETDTTNTYRWMGTGWLLWDMGGVWTNFAYATGFTNNSVADTHALRWTIRNGVLFVEGIVFGSFGTAGTAVPVTTTANVPPTAYRPVAPFVQARGACGGQSAKTGTWTWVSDGTIALAWNALGTTATSPAWLELMFSIPAQF